jgi:hypothetical protein
MVKNILGFKRTLPLMTAYENFAVEVQDRIKPFIAKRHDEMVSEEKRYWNNISHDFSKVMTGNTDGRPMEDVMYHLVENIFLYMYSREMIR